MDEEQSLHHRDGVETLLICFVPCFLKLEKGIGLWNFILAETCYILVYPMNMQEFI